METEGIILKNIKIIKGRRMINVLTEKSGMISAGTSISEKGKSRSSLAIRPFTHGRYIVTKSRDMYFINEAETINSHFGLAEDVDKYLQSSYILELTGKMLHEDEPIPQIFDLLKTYLSMLERRTAEYDLLTLTYQVKILQFTGLTPQTDNCIICGSAASDVLFSIQDGGITCKKCAEKLNSELLYKVNFDIVNALRYLLQNPLNSVENLKLNEVVQNDIKRIIKAYTAYHADIGELKSEALI